MKDFKEISILYVEDDDNVRESLLRFLKRRFQNIYTACDGREGLESYLEHRPDVIITDIQMPVMDGLKMSEEIRKMNPDIPIVVTTAFNESPFITKAEELGVCRYIKKPVVKEELIQSLLECSRHFTVE